MTDERNDEAEAAAGAPEAADDQPRMGGSGPTDPRYLQRNLANRLFPGPSNRMSRQAADRIEGLLKPRDGEGPNDRRNWKSNRTSAPVENPKIATPDGIAQLRETLDQQNELLRAILASSVDTQTDARSTAQNSRTFAWAGTAIALLTLIATVISIVAAIQAG